MSLTPDQITKYLTGFDPEQKKIIVDKIIRGGGNTELLNFIDSLGEERRYDYLEVLLDDINLYESLDLIGGGDRVKLDPEAESVEYELEYEEEEPEYEEERKEVKKKEVKKKEVVIPTQKILEENKNHIAEMKRTMVSMQTSIQNVADRPINMTVVSKLDGKKVGEGVDKHMRKNARF